MAGAGSGRVAMLAALLAVSCATMPASLAQTGGEAMQAIPEPGFDAAKAAFEALPEGDRVAVQDALVWTGDYASGADGSFGRRTFEGIVAWQRRSKRPTNGILDRPGLTALVAAGQRARGAAGFAIVVDAASGVRIGIPQKLLPKKNANTIGGTRFQSADDRVTLDTRSQPGSADDLRALYERNLAIQTAGRNVTYKLARPDFFVIAGETAGGRFYSRYAQDGGTIRGFSIGYDKALAGEFDRITVAIANSFQPFGPARPLPGQMAEQPSLPPVAAAPPPAGSGMAPPGAAASFTGLTVSARRVLAPAAVQEACREIRLDGQPARVLSAARGLAVLEPAAPRRTVTLRFASGNADGPGIVLFHAAEEGGRAVVAPAELVAGSRLIAPLQAGGAGAVVLDRSGAVAGLVGALTPGRRAVAGLVPPAAYPYLPAAELREVAGQMPATEAAAPKDATLGALAAAVMPALARITCAAPPPAALAPQAPALPPRRP